MKSNTSKFVAILVVAGALATGAYIFGGYENVIKLNQSDDSTEQTDFGSTLPSTSEYEDRVKAIMEETKAEWEEKHRLWAEQEVSKGIILEQEARLEALRAKELSL